MFIEHIVLVLKDIYITNKLGKQASVEMLHF